MLLVLDARPRFKETGCLMADWSNMKALVKALLTSNVTGA